MQAVSFPACDDVLTSDEEYVDPPAVCRPSSEDVRPQQPEHAAQIEEPGRSRRPLRALPSNVRLAGPQLEPAVAVVGGPARGDWPAQREQVVAGARALAGHMRALQQRYEEEHRRLADSLEFLAVQSRDLERELAAFGQLASMLESDSAGYLAASAPTAIEPGRRALLEVRCLGAFEVHHSGRPVDLGTSRNGRLIFKYLVARAPGGRASKELLAELFWPGTPPERALPSLQSALHQLRAAMGRCEPWLRVTPAIVYADDIYSLNPHLDIRTDVSVFRRRLSEARARDARGERESASDAYRLAQEAYGGEFLPEERYEDWAMTERASLEAEQIKALTRLVELHMANADYSQAIEFGRRLLELDVTREDMHRDVMRCHSRLGQRTEGLRQFRRCFEALQSELEVAPDAETTALFDHLARGELI